jgi:heme exporter protein A
MIGPAIASSSHAHTPRLAAEAVACFRGERLVLRDLSLALDAGGALLLLGANGAGKSTLLRLLAGLKRADAGRILWNGADIAEDRAAHGARCGFLGEANALKPGLTASENLRFAAKCRDGSHDEGSHVGHDIAAALAAFDLAPLADLPARMLSAGQRRRLALARLLVLNAPLWLLDEPTLGLDAASVARLGEVLAQHRAAGGLVVAATHLDLPLPEAIPLRLGS